MGLVSETFVSLLSLHADSLSMLQQRAGGTLSGHGIEPEGGAALQPCFISPCVDRLVLLKIKILIAIITQAKHDQGIGQPCYMRRLPQASSCWRCSGKRDTWSRLQHLLQRLVIAGHLQVAFPSMAALDPDRPLPVGDTGAAGGYKFLVQPPG